jgi:agmatine deiminase
VKHSPGHVEVTVYVSDWLKERFAKFSRDLADILERHGVGLVEVSGTADQWVRDYFPIQRHDGVFIAYTYQPDYLKGYSHLVTHWKKIRGLPRTWKVEDCGLILDGGNVVLNQRSAILTSKVFTENPALSQRQVEARLRRALQLDTLVVIPPEPGDVVGHADGMVAWTGPDRVILNDYRKIDPAFRLELLARLNGAGIEAVEVPYSPVRSRKSIPPATGNYSNSLILPGVVLVPTYGMPSDDKAMKIVADQFPNRQVLPVACAGIAAEGGSIHCVTAEVQMTCT